MDGGTDEEGNNNRPVGEERVKRRVKNPAAIVRDWDLDGDESSVELLDVMPEIPDSEPDKQRAYGFLEKLYNHNADEGLVAVDEVAGRLINRSFTHLESRLGSVGRKCVAAYHKWGNQFWKTDAAKESNGLINGYWSQVAICVSNRMNAINKRTIGGQPPIIPPIFADQVNADPRARTYADRFEKEITLVNSEIGYFRSIARRIIKDADFRCQPDADDNLMSCTRPIPTEKWQAWTKIVIGIVKTWRDAHKSVNDVLVSFEKFLVVPTLENWNRLIALGVMVKFTEKLLSEIWFPPLQYASNLVTQRWLRSLDTELQRWPLATMAPRTSWYPPGYTGLLSSMSLSPNDMRILRWNDINRTQAKMAEEQGILLVTILDNDETMNEAFKWSKGTVPEPILKADMEELSESRDPALTKAAKRGKKKREKALKNRDSLEEDVESLDRASASNERASQEPVVFVNKPEGSEEDDNIVTMQEVQQEFNDIRITVKATTDMIQKAPDDAAVQRAVQTFVTQIGMQPVLGSLMQLYCALQNPGLNRQMAQDAVDAFASAVYPRRQDRGFGRSGTPFTVNNDESSSSQRPKRNLPKTPDAEQMVQNDQEQSPDAKKFADANPDEMDVYSGDDEQEL